MTTTSTDNNMTSRTTSIDTLLRATGHTTTPQPQKGLTIPGLTISRDFHICRSLSWLFLYCLGFAVIDIKINRFLTAVAVTSLCGLISLETQTGHGALRHVYSSTAATTTVSTDKGQNILLSQLTSCNKSVHHHVFRPPLAVHPPPAAKQP